MVDRLHATASNAVKMERSRQRESAAANLRSMLAAGSAGLGSAST